MSYKELDKVLNEKIKESNRQIIVLDDDPTGVQTVHGVSVYTDWSIESIREGFNEDTSLFYILTNSRSLDEDQTKNIYSEIANNIMTISKEINKQVLIITRSDSTLRGHYPLENYVIKDVLEDNNIHIDGEILSFFFYEGGRVTLNDTHYVIQDSQLVPSSETEFAKDPTFGYENSNLKMYIQEKTMNDYKYDEIESITLKDLSNYKYDSIYNKLMKQENFNKLVLNSISYNDLKVFAISFYEALKNKEFIIRSSASLVKVLGGITDRPLLNKNEMINKNTEYGGLVVVGSYTNKTNKQLENLLTHSQVVGIEINSDLILESESALEEEVEKKTKEVEDIISSGRTAVCYTKRKLIKVVGEAKSETLLRSSKISDSLKDLVSGLSIEPKFIIAKGGITSSDIGTKALEVRKALVLGQILEGVPVWKTGEESKFPDIPYIIFPGNTGNEKGLIDAANKLLE